jgi:mutator protein MutT
MTAHPAPVIPVVPAAATAIDVAAAVIVYQGLVLLAQRLGGDLDGLWEFPGGKFDPGEGWQEATIRELQEELNLEVRPRKRLAVIEHQYPAKRVRLHFVLCDLPTNLDRTTVSGVSTGTTGWFLPADLLRQKLCPADRIAVTTIPWQEICP